MSIWKDETDFMNDIENISEFFISGEHNNTKTKFMFKSKNEKKPLHTPWYEDSDDDEDLSKPEDNIHNPAAEPDSHQLRKEIQMQVRSAVGNRYNNEVLETYYNICRDEEANDGPSLAPIELSISYAKEQKYKKKYEKPSPILKIQSNTENIDPTNSSGSKKTSIAENIEQAAAKLNISDHRLTENSISNIPTLIPHNSSVYPEPYQKHNPEFKNPWSQPPRKEFKQRGYGKPRINSRNYGNHGPRINYNQSQNNKRGINVNCKKDFPSLS